MKRLLIVATISIPFFIYCQNTFKHEMDSIWLSNGSNYQNAIQEGYYLSCRYPNDTLSHEFIYSTRRFHPKEDLRSFIKLVDSRLLNSSYLKSLNYYISNVAIKQGDLYKDFSAFNEQGTEIRLSSIVNNKNVLLIFGGLDCMGKQSFNRLKETYSKIKKSETEIVSFTFVKNIEKLKSEKSRLQVPWITISDFNLDHSQTQIIYDVQITPRVIHIRKGGRIIEASDGLTESAFEFLAIHTDQSIFIKKKRRIPSHHFLNVLSHILSKLFLFIVQLEK